jgi:hypothetical protein
MLTVHRRIVLVPHHHRTHVGGLALEGAVKGLQKWAGGGSTTPLLDGC